MREADSGFSSCRYYRSVTWNGVADGLTTHVRCMCVCSFRHCNYRKTATKGLPTIFVLHVVRGFMLRGQSFLSPIYIKSSRGYLALSVRRARFIGVQWWKINTLVWRSLYPVRLPLGQALS